MTDTPAQSLEERQPFEAHPKLASHLRRMAVQGHVGSAVEWGNFLSELNNALPKPGPAGEVGEEAEPFNEHEAAFRKVGFTGDAINYPLSPRAFEWLCEFNGISPDKAPWQWAYAPNPYMQRYLDSRAAEAYAALQPGTGVEG